MGEFAGDIIAQISDCPFLVPRGKYSIQFYSTFAKFHGRSNNFKILYRDISKAFLLLKNDGINMVYVLQLRTPIRQGQTMHYYLVLQFERETEVKVTINLTPEQLKDQFDDRLQSELSGPLYEVISRLFKELIQITIMIPGEFRSTHQEQAVKCSVKAQDGYLYPMKSSLIFIHKPVIYIKFTEIKHIEFSRIEQGATSSKSFDVTVTRIKDDTSVSFAGIEKTEQKKLTDYFKSKGIKLRTIDIETNQQIAISDEEDDEQSKGDESQEKQ